MRIRRLPQAIRDVDEIWRRIAEDGIEAADRWVDRIVEATDRLAHFPNSGAPRLDIGSAVRSIVMDRYLVLYRVGPYRIDTVRGVHGARERGGMDGDPGK